MAAPKIEKNERRNVIERRKSQIPVAIDRRKGERRLGERRRQVDPTTCERDYTDEEIGFMKAMEDYKASFARPFPTWSEVLEVLKSIGYRKVAGTTATAVESLHPVRLLSMAKSKIPIQKASVDGWGRGRSPGFDPTRIDPGHTPSHTTLAHDSL